MHRPQKHLLSLACLLVWSSHCLARDNDNPTIDMLPADINWQQAPIISIQMGDNHFVPEDITLKLNQPYRLILNNISDQATHNITSLPFFHAIVLKNITVAGVTINTPHLHNLTMRPNSISKLFLVPIKKGELEFHCAVPGHKESGMEGFITITQ